MSDTVASLNEDQPSAWDTHTDIQIHYSIVNRYATTTQCNYCTMYTVTSKELLGVCARMCVILL